MLISKRKRKVRFGTNNTRHFSIYTYWYFCIRMQSIQPLLCSADLCCDKWTKCLFLLNFNKCEGNIQCFQIVQHVVLTGSQWKASIVQYVQAMYIQMHNGCLAIFNLDSFSLLSLYSWCVRVCCICLYCCDVFLYM